MLCETVIEAYREHLDSEKYSKDKKELFSLLSELRFTAQYSDGHWMFGHNIFRSHFFKRGVDLQIFEKLADEADRFNKIDITAIISGSGGKVSLVEDCLKRFYEGCDYRNVRVTKK